MRNASSQHNSFIVCVYSLDNTPSAGRLLGEALRLVAGALGREESTLVGDVFYNHNSKESGDDHIGKSVHMPLRTALTGIADQHRLEFLSGAAWLASSSGAVRRPRNPPITLQYSAARPNRAQIGAHSMVLFSIAAEMLETLSWQRLHEVLRDLVALFERSVNRVVSLFVELAHRDKHAAGEAYGDTVVFCQDLQFRIEQMLWNSAPLDQQLKIRGVFWGTYLSIDHLRAIQEPENLPKRLARWYGGVDTPRSTVSCWNTPRGGLWIELSPSPCGWPNSEPITHDPDGVRTVYNEFHRAGFFGWKSGLMRS